MTENETQSSTELAGEMEKLNATDCTTSIEEDKDGDIVDPWKVESKSAKGVDYDKLISKYFSPNQANDKYFATLPFFK